MSLLASIVRASKYVSLILGFLAFGYNSRALATSIPQAPSVKIVGEITQDTALDVLKAATSLPRVLNVIINSPGGSTDAAGLIVRAFKTLSDNGTRINCAVIGHAYSAAFWILQACTVRIAFPDAALLIHEPAMYYGGETPVIMRLEILREIVRGLSANSDEIAATCAPRMLLKVQEFHNKLAKVKDWMMTPAEALANHAIDRITTN